MKKLLSIAICFSLLFSSISCKDEDVEANGGKEVNFVKLSFIDTDGSFEDSKIFKVIDVLVARLFSENLTVTEDITLQSGDYDVVQFKKGTIVITGEVSFRNLNPMNTGDDVIKILILKEGRLNLPSSLNQNGNFEIINYGDLYTRNHEMQSATIKNNRKNTFSNFGNHYIDGDLQISSDNSFYTNGGFISVSHNTNFHQRGYIAYECGQLITYGLNVNIDNAVSGKGFIKVMENLNLNHKLTESSQIEFSYCDAANNPRQLKNQEPQNLGAAVRVCQATCTPGSMPIKYRDLKIVRLGNKLKITFDILESSDIQGMRVLYSPNAIKWKEIYIEKPEKLIANTRYQSEIVIPE